MLTLDLDRLVDWTQPLFETTFGDTLNPTTVDDLVKRRNSMLDLYGSTAFAVHAKMSEDGTGSLTKHHVNVLGRQHVCRPLGSENRRFWIWQLWPDAVLMVNNTKGVCLEVIPETTFSRSCEVMRDYSAAVCGTSIPDWRKLNG